MKKTILGLFAFVCAFSGVSCSEDDLSGTSVIKPEQTTETPLDAWLYKNYIEPYNIEFRYRYEDMESDMIYDLTPANYEKSVQMAKLVKHLCLQAYDEVTGSRDFITSYFPKMVFLVGSPAYNNNGEVVLGTAEGGTKITLYAVNNMDPTNVDLLNEWYFKTIHHEFAHILNQKKPFSTDFNQITGLATGIRYVGNACWDVYPSEDLALKDGFISRYASTSAEGGVRGGKLHLRHQHGRHLGGDARNGRRGPSDARSQIRDRGQIHEERLGNRSGRIAQSRFYAARKNFRTLDLDATN